MFTFAAPITMHSATRLLGEAQAAFAKGEREYSLAAVEGSDSALMAVMLDLQRSARLVNEPLRFRDVPQGMINFAELYGVLEMFPDLVVRPAIA